jgi:hypothetical protein
MQDCLERGKGGTVGTGEEAYGWPRLEGALHLQYVVHTLVRGTYVSADGLEGSSVFKGGVRDVAR